MSSMEPGLGVWQVFSKDLASAFRAWRRAPLLPVSSVLIALVASRLTPPFTDPNSYIIVAIATVLTSMVIAGWFGTERIWYLRVYRGKGIRPVELWTLTRAFALRYFLLGLIVITPINIVFAEAGRRLFSAAPISESTVRAITNLAFFLNVPIVVLLTFVTPALAYTTHRIRMALGIGWRMVLDEWPRSAGYALVPPLAILISLQMLPGSALGTVGWLVWVLLNLWFKGATAAFYLRQYEAGDNGAAFSSEESWPKTLTTST